MKGKHSIIVQNRKVRFSFEVERNISIVRGESATGKTTLISMIADFQRLGTLSGVQLSCDKQCVVMIGLEAKGPNNFEDFLKKVSDSIVFIDEGERYISSKEFAAAISKTDNYYVIATRDNLYELPYSVDAIFEIVQSGKYGKLKRTYNSFKKIYGDSPRRSYSYKDNDNVIVEDQKSGYQFYKKASEYAEVKCLTAKGKSNILHLVRETKGKTLIIADGAAFGAEMANVYGVTRNKQVDIFLPESFEWLILNSGIVDYSELSKILDNPSDYIKSEEFFSWEQYFSALLVAISKGKEYRYNKSSLNDYYISPRNIKRILGKFFEDFDK